MNLMPTPRQTWDAELYEARHSFVWQLGEGVVALLDPKPGERILDLGCGTGQLTNKIAEHGADVTGLDASPEMIGQARQNYPRLRFVLQDAASMQFDQEFDAVFSNAALHWMIDGAGVARGIARALRPGGRFVAEMGGKGNIAQIEAAFEHVFSPRGIKPERRTWYPSIAEYAALLERAGLETRTALLFDRPTPLQGPAAMEDWIRQFKWYCFEDLTAQQQTEALNQTVEYLRPTLFRDGQWYADYRRLRIVALKL
jgi:trans-aconitate methyltransferase